jgi:hypothetical protein
MFSYLDGGLWESLGTVDGERARNLPELDTMEGYASVKINSRKIRYRADVSPGSLS